MKRQSAASCGMPASALAVTSNIEPSEIYRMEGSVIFLVSYHYHG